MKGPSVDPYFDTLEEFLDIEKHLRELDDARSVSPDSAVRGRERRAILLRQRAEVLADLERMELEGLRTSLKPQGAV